MSSHSKKIPAGKTPLLSIAGIQDWCIHDGPGLRAGVFFKGCPLHCLWCCNPETLHAKQEVGLIQARCLGWKNCGLCLSACRNEAIYKHGGVVNLNRDACVMCGKCLKACPAQALFLWGRQMSVAEIMEELSKSPAMQEPLRGVTLSGGEPLMNPAGTLALLKELEKRSCHIAIETCGFFDMTNPAILEALALTDLLYYDIKHPFPAQHRQGTGVDHARILENLARIARQFPELPIIIRTPLLTGYNDSVPVMEAIKNIILLTPTVIRHELILYHPFGEDKYAQLGLQPNPQYRGSCNPQHMERLTNIFKQAGIPVAVL